MADLVNFCKSLLILLKYGTDSNVVKDIISQVISDLKYWERRNALELDKIWIKRELFWRMILENFNLMLVE